MPFELDEFFRFVFKSDSSWLTTWWASNAGGYYFACRRSTLRSALLFAAFFGVRKVLRRCLRLVRKMRVARALHSQLFCSGANNASSSTEGFSLQRKREPCCEATASELESCCRRCFGGCVLHFELDEFRHRRGGGLLVVLFRNLQVPKRVHFAPHPPPHKKKRKKR